MPWRPRVPHLSHRPAAVEPLEVRRLLATFTVNVSGDAGAASSTGSTASRTLRQAINAANGTSAADTIVFNLPGSFTSIQVGYNLPRIAYPVTIDGTSESLQTESGTEAGVFLTPASSSSATLGLDILANNVTIRRLGIGGFDQYGIAIYGGSGNLIAGSYIGTNANGTSAVANGIGVALFSPNNTIGGTSGLDRNVICGNVGDGVYIAGTNATGNVVAGNAIGYGGYNTALPNGGNGVQIRGASGNRIGAATAAQGGVAARNYISGNALDGVHIEQSADLSSTPATVYDADDNVVAGNYIGVNANGGSTDPAGERAVPNGGSGVRIISGEDNVIGSADPVGRNIISGNTGRGVTITAVSTTFGPNTVYAVAQNNVVIGNYVGLSASGAALGNGRAGVVLEENQNGIASFVQSNRVGGTAAGEGNVIGSNTYGGIAVQLNAGSTTIQGNIIGLDPTGTAARPNGEGGVALNNSSSNIVGGLSAAARNVISGNTGDGVRIITSTTSSDAADFNTVTNNYIGTSAAGTAAVPNTQYGVRIVGGSNNQIGDSRIDTGVAGNLISGNKLAGVAIGVDTAEFTERGTTNLNVVRNNSIGINADGTAVLANGSGIIVSGVTAVPTTNTTIGGAGTGINRRGNLIVGANKIGSGISIGGAASGVSVLGNRVGTTPAGTAKLGQLFQGLYVAAPDVTVGSTAAGGGNVFAGAFKEGVQIAHPSNNVTLVANGIGTDLAGTADLGNVEAGVYVNLILSSDANITLGGTTAASANRIAHNGADGVVMDDFGRGVEIVGNRIFENAGLGIDLGDDGVNLNDVGDGDGGPNDLQNFPVVSVPSPAGPSATSVTITAAMTAAAPNTALRIDFYAVGTPDPTGYGEGDLYLGSANVTTNASGNVSTTQTFSLAGLPGATRVTATATRTADGSTSEFSLGASLIDTTPPTALGTTYAVNSVPPSVRIAFTENVAASLVPADFVVQNLTPATPTTVPTANIAVSFDTATNTAVLTFPGYPRGTPPNGSYRVTLAAGAFADANGNANTAAYTGTFFVLAGDANRDRKVDFNDFLVVQANFNQTGRTFTQGDFNYDGKTDFDDFLILQSNFNATV